MEYYELHELLIYIIIIVYDIDYYWNFDMKLANANIFNFDGCLWRIKFEYNWTSIYVATFNRTRKRIFQKLSVKLDFNAMLLSFKWNWNEIFNEHHEIEMKWFIQPKMSESNSWNSKKEDKTWNGPIS